MDFINAEVLKLFGYVGIMSIAGLIGLIFWAFFEWLKDRIRDARQNYRIKHRFDGKPIAKCWCRDCRAYNNKTRQCLLCNMYKLDNGFCDRADPVWREVEHKGEEK